MEECPICRINIENLSVTNSYIFDELIEIHCAEPQVSNYYTVKMDTSNIINYYLRKPEIECPFCFEQMKSPRILNCGHTICSECCAKFNWNKGKFIQAKFWKQKYYEYVFINNENIRKYKNDINKLIITRNYLRRKNQSWDNYFK